MATKLKIEKRGDEIIPLEMHFFVDSLLLVTQIIKGKQLYYKMKGQDQIPEEGFLMTKDN
jgi:hypothetical protein